MAFKITGRMEGIAGAVQKMASLQKRVRSNVQRKAVRRMTTLVLKSARAGLTRIRTGQLKKSLGSKVKAYRSGIVLGIVGPRKGHKITVTNAAGETVNIDPVFYAHLVEFGTVHSPAYPFLRPAWDGNKQACVGIVKETVREAFGRS
jgi:HK97 gp10 family phage protein